MLMSVTDDITIIDNKMTFLPPEEETFSSYLIEE